MNLNATLLGQSLAFFILFSILLIGSLSYYLGKRKTKNPKITAFIGILLSFMPPLALIYIAVLVLKNDVEKNNDITNT
ncbi:MAG: hypothetical protein HRU22_09310 [Gammaproteobacteria bacterium]|nr:hypothetical protein [Gammaproteobacteria bacterium]